MAELAFQANRMSPAGIPMSDILAKISTRGTRVSCMTVIRSSGLVSQDQANQGEMSDQLDFVAAVQDMLAEAWDDYVVLPAVGQRPRQPGPYESAVLHSKWVADWNKWVLRSTMGTLPITPIEPR